MSDISLPIYEKYSFCLASGLAPYFYLDRASGCISARDQKPVSPFTLIKQKEDIFACFICIGDKGDFFLICPSHDVYTCTIDNDFDKSCFR